MKKAFLLLIVTGFYFYPAWSQLAKSQADPRKVAVPAQHYQAEYSFDKPADLQAWSVQKGGLHASYGSEDELYMRCEVPGVTENNSSWEGTGWKGERLNTQVLIWSPDTLKQIRVRAGDLSGTNGQIIKSSQISIRIVRYVLSSLPYGSGLATCGTYATDTAFLMPDRFEEAGRFDLPSQTVRPVWISINIPPGAVAGTYKGSIEVDGEKQHIRLPLSIHVQNQVLPNPHDWKYRLDLWQNPWVVAEYYHVKPWSDEHLTLLKKHMKLYADLGGTYITTYAVHSPWSDNSYTIEGTMIEWLKKKDGQWQFDYSIFDKYVSLAMEMGIDRAITVYTPVPWGYRFRYMDEVSGNYAYAEWSPLTDAFRENFGAFLNDLKKHLQQKGWFEKTYLGINENPLEITLAAAKMIKENDPHWKITYAGDWHPELTALLDDYCPVISSEPSQKELDERKSRHVTTTFYVCCNPPRPNNFVFSPPVEGRFISWYAASRGYDGFLRWAYDAWPADPLRDARHTFWPSGDTHLVYPGGNACIRYEKLREGIVDYEKIRILREKAAASPDKKVKDLLQKLNTHLEKFRDDPDYSKRDYNTAKLNGLLQDGRKIVDELSDALAASN